MKLSANPLFRVLKSLLKATFWPQGSVRRIFRGPCKGLHYEIFPGYGWSPLYGGWEPKVQSLMLRYVGPDSVAYDVGANFGIHALLLARLTSAGKGEVHAFEPLPGIMAALRRNIGMNGFNHVVFVQKALSNQAGSSEFLGGAHGGAGHLVRPGESASTSVSVEMMSLDAYVFDFGNRAPTFLKIDVEGAESRVLEGGKRVLTEARPILLMDLHGEEQEVSVGRILATHGYRIHRVDDGRKVEKLGSGHTDPLGVPDEILAVPS